MGHRWQAVERRERKTREWCGHTFVYQYRWTCSCGFSTGWSKHARILAAQRNRHALDGQLSIDVD